MFKNYASIQTPTTTDAWKTLSTNQRSELIYKEIKKNPDLNNFEVYKTLDDGQVIFRVKETISSSKRGILLLNLEDQLKKNIDIGLTVWFEPIGDKSKLRNLRGISFEKE